VEAVIPVEISEPSNRVQHFNEKDNEMLLCESNDLLEEVREEAALKNAAYQQKMAKYHDVKVVPKKFKEGDLVLRKAEFVKPPGKLDPKWEGPYIVYEEVVPGTYRLMRQNGDLISRTWNLDHLRPYYQ
jgi:hypothetical protein